MSIITVSDKYKIEVDEYNHTLYVMQESYVIDSGKRKGEMTKGGWSLVGYYPNVAQALSKITQTEVHDCDYDTLGDYITALNNTYDRMREKVEVSV
jgi:hypothetical protein